jgi:CoA:oxalate CoA-transferase
MPLIDRITALHGTIGVLAALRERELSGEGQSIDVCLADSGFSLTEIPIVHYLGSGVIPRREGSRVASSLSNVYRTKDGWAYVVGAGANENIWARLCEILGHPEWLKDSRLANRGGRARNAALIEAEMEKWFSTRTTEESVGEMSEIGIPCAPVNDVPQASRSPQIWERELLVEVPDALAGTIHVSGKFIKLSRSKDIIGSAPVAGQHTTEILRDLLRYSPSKIEALRSRRIVASPEDTKG